MFALFKKETSDLVKEWQTVKLASELAKKSDEDKKKILNYIENNKSELTVVLSSLTEATRLKNGSKMSKGLFYEVLEWIHSVVWPPLLIGCSSNSNYRKSYDYYFAAYKEAHGNPEAALAKYKEIMKYMDNS